MASFLFLSREQKSVVHFKTSGKRIKVINTLTDFYMNFYLNIFTPSHSVDVLMSMKPNSDSCSAASSKDEREVQIF